MAFFYKQKVFFVTKNKLFLNSTTSLNNFSFYLRFVKERRQTISPNFNFLGQLYEYQKQQANLTKDEANTDTNSKLSAHSPTSDSAGLSFLKFTKKSFTNSIKQTQTESTAESFSLAQHQQQRRKQYIFQFNDSQPASSNLLSPMKSNPAFTMPTLANNNKLLLIQSQENHLLPSPSQAFSNINLNSPTTNHQNILNELANENHLKHQPKFVPKSFTIDSLKGFLNSSNANNDAEPKSTVVMRRPTNLTMSLSQPPNSISIESKMDTSSSSSTTTPKSSLTNLQNSSNNNNSKPSPQPTPKTTLKRPSSILLTIGANNYSNELLSANSPTKSPNEFSLAKEKRNFDVGASSIGSSSSSSSSTSSSSSSSNTVTPLARTLSNTSAGSTSSSCSCCSNVSSSSNSACSVCSNQSNFVYSSCSQLQSFYTSNILQQQQQHQQQQQQQQYQYQKKIKLSPIQDKFILGSFAMCSKLAAPSTQTPQLNSLFSKQQFKTQLKLQPNTSLMNSVTTTTPTKTFTASSLLSSFEQQANTKLNTHNLILNDLESPVFTSNSNSNADCYESMLKSNNQTQQSLLFNESSLIKSGKYSNGTSSSLASNLISNLNGKINESKSLETIKSLFEQTNTTLQRRKKNYLNNDDEENIEYSESENDEKNSEKKQEEKNRSNSSLMNSSSLNSINTMLSCSATGNSNNGNQTKSSSSSSSKDGSNTNSLHGSIETMIEVS